MSVRFRGRVFFLQPLPKRIISAPATSLRLQKTEISMVRDHQEDDSHTVHIVSFFWSYEQKNIEFPGSCNKLVDRIQPNHGKYIYILYIYTCFISAILYCQWLVKCT